MKEITQERLLIRIQWCGHVLTIGNTENTSGLTMTAPDKRLVGRPGTLEKPNTGWHTHKRWVTEGAHTQEHGEWWVMVMMISRGHFKVIHFAVFLVCNLNTFNFCRFEACWPALQRHAHGIIFVYNPSTGDHARDLEMLYNYFVTQTGFNHKNCVVFANQKQSADKDVKYSSKLCMSAFLIF